MAAPDRLPQALPTTHRFIDEVGDTTFYGRGKEMILGHEGVSLIFGMSLVRFGRPIGDIRSEITELQNKVASDPFFSTNITEKTTSSTLTCSPT